MVKFGKPEATWKTGEEENSYGGEWRGVVARSERGREHARGEREGGESNERSSTRELRAADGRTYGKEIRDKETDTDNEKTSTAKKEAGEKAGLRERARE